MIKFLEDRNIGLDFKTKKVKLPKNLGKLQQLYRAVVISKCYGDVCLLNPQELPDMDLFTYSTPCQDFSVAGKQKGAIRGQTRSGLLYECEKIIEAKRPKYLLMENVKNLVGKKFKEQFDEWLDYLESLGYTNYWSVLNAKDFGVPQNRERVFVVSILNDEDKDYIFPSKQPLNIRLKDVLESQVEDKHYVSDEVQARFKANEKFKDMSGIVVESSVKEVGYLPYNETNKKHQSNTVYDANGLTPTLSARDYKGSVKIIEQQNEKSFNKFVSELSVERIGGCFDDEKGTHQAGSVYSQEGLAPTLDTMQGGWRQPCIINEPNYRIRKLTPLECWRLMRCSDEDFYKAKLFNSDSQLYKQAGNSIVVDVLEGIFYNLFNK